MAIPDSASPAGDPRDIVTDYAFRVSSGLIGTPLALPWRRAVALTVDGVIVAILANAPGVIFGFATAFVLLRAARKPVAGGVIRRSVRRATRFAAAVVLFLVSVSLWNALAELRAGDAERVDATRSESSVVLGGIAGVRTGADVVGLLRSRNEAEARERLERIVAEARRGGMGEEPLTEFIRELSASGSTAVRAAADSVLAELAAARGDAGATRLVSADSLVAAYAAALESGDSASAPALRAQLGSALSGGTVTALREDLMQAQRRNALLAAQVEELEEQGGVIEGFLDLLEDLGLGIGWTGLYFTAFVVLWRGQTPGKRLLRLRVVRLDNMPIGWWSAFERFAGYAAGLATGLLGFLQIFWDHNRQAVQDKISRTVVIQE